MYYDYFVLEEECIMKKSRKTLLILGMACILSVQGAIALANPIQMSQGSDSREIKPVVISSVNIAEKENDTNLRIQMSRGSNSRHIEPQIAVNIQEESVNPWIPQSNN